MESPVMVAIKEGIKTIKDTLDPIQEGSISRN